MKAIADDQYSKHTDAADALVHEGWANRSPTTWPMRDGLSASWPVGPIRHGRASEMLELRQKFTIAIVTHNLQQAQRVADYTGFLYVDTTQGGRTGYLVEFNESKQLFDDPHHAHTKQYIRGEFS